MKVIIAGDTHGNIEWLRRYLFPVAVTARADKLVVLGDFGAWEHTRAGVEFFDQADAAAARAGIPLYWLHGNHDKFSHTLAAYGTDRDPEGFVRCRDNLFYIPQGHAWRWLGTSLRAFGGAYSVDRAWRVQAEQDRYRKLVTEARVRRVPVEHIPAQDGTLWFPEEEMTDDEIEQLLLDDFGRKDIILSHDKPLSAKPDWNRKEIPACVPNQIRLERALRLHKPAWWFHGHLHYHYRDTLTGKDFRTTVTGLDPDNAAAEHTGWQRENTWALLELAGGLRVSMGRDIEISQADLGEARAALV